MFETVYQANFTDKVINARKPILLSYLLADHDYNEYMAMLARLAIKFGGKITIYLLPQDNFFLRGKLLILGDPSFVGFIGGIEKGRLLGRVLFEELAALCERLLVNVE